MTNAELTRYNQNREVVQVGYASADVWRTIRQFRDLLDIAPWQVCTVSDANSRHVKLYEKRIGEPFDFKCAHCQIGNMDFEVLAPVYGPNAYTQFIAEKGEGIQHPKERFAKEDLWDVTLDAEEAGARVMLTGGVDIDRFVYLDMQQQGAAVYELGNQPDMELVCEHWPQEDTAALEAANRERRITQIAYLTDDLRRVTDMLSRALKMGPWTVATLNERNTQDFRVYDAPVEDGFELKVAICQRGDMQIEVLQPVRGLSPLTEHLRRRGEVVHHVKERLDAAQMERFAQKMRAKGCPPCLSGRIGEETFLCFDLTDFGLSAYVVGGPTGRIRLDGLETETWPEAD